MSMEGRDIHSLYMDDGYLFFSAKPIEKIVANDSIDIDIIIHMKASKHTSIVLLLKEIQEQMTE